MCRHSLHRPHPGCTLAAAVWYLCHAPTTPSLVLAGTNTRLACRDAAGVMPPHPHAGCPHPHAGSPHSQPACRLSSPACRLSSLHAAPPACRLSSPQREWSRSNIVLAAGKLTTFALELSYLCPTPAWSLHPCISRPAATHAAGGGGGGRAPGGGSMHAAGGGLLASGCPPAGLQQQQAPGLMLDLSRGFGSYVIDPRCGRGPTPRPRAGLSPWGQPGGKFWPGGIQREAG
jgi:hypothetical protein